MSGSKKAAKAAAASRQHRRQHASRTFVPALICVAVACIVTQWIAPAGDRAPSAPTAEVKEKVPRTNRAARVATESSSTNRAARAATESSARQDNHTNCAAWVAAGECDRNAAFMLDQCAAACAAIEGERGDSALAGERGGDAALPDGWKEYVDAASGRAYFSDGVTSQWERPGRSAAAAARPAGGAAEANRATVQHLEDTWHTPSECTAWAGSGQCDANPGFMLVSCERSCHSVGVSRSEYAARCKRAADAKPALEPGGGMAATFERIMSDFGHLEPEMISADPPVVLFHKFLAADEADAFVAHGRGRYTESKGVGVDKNGRMTDVKTQIRTSSHAWCQDAPCLGDPLVQRVIARVSDVTQTPATNAEFAQLVYYQSCPADTDPSCAFYKRHSDYIDGDRHRNQGVRIYTLFMYLNDVLEGGGTRFTDLPDGPVTFQPQKGKAILWPSVLAGDPDTVDPRTHHEALPVTQGEKFGANFWIHQYDFKTPHAVGCTMD